MNRTRFLLIVSAVDRDIANVALEDAGYGPNNLSVPLVPTSRTPVNPPPTHYAANWQMSGEDEIKVKDALKTVGVMVKWQDLGHYRLDRITIQPRQVMENEDIKPLRE